MWVSVCNSAVLQAHGDDGGACCVRNSANIDGVGGVDMNAKRAAAQISHLAACHVSSRRPAAPAALAAPGAPGGPSRAIPDT